MISAAMQEHMHLKRDSQSRIIIHERNDHCLIQPHNGELNCSLIPTFCKGQFWLDLSKEICFKERRCQSRFSGNALTKQWACSCHTVSGKHSETTTPKLPGSKQGVDGQNQPHWRETNDRGSSDFKIWTRTFLFTWDCKQHFPPGTESCNSQLLQILICESEECLKIDLWVNKSSIINILSFFFSINSTHCYTYLLITLCLLSKKEWWGQYKPKGQELSNKGGKMKVMILAEDLI